MKHRETNDAPVYALKRQIRGFFDEAVYRFGDYEFSEAGEYDELDAIFQTATLLHPLDQIDVYWYALVSANAFHDTRPIGTGNIEDAFRRYAKAVGRLGLTPKEKQPYIDNLVQALDWGMCGYGDVTGSIKTALDTVAHAPEDYSYLIRKLSTISLGEAPDWIAGYYLKLGDDKQYLKIRQAHVRYEHQCVELARYWQEKGKEEKYVAVLEQWVRRLPTIRRTAGLYIPPDTFPGALQLLRKYYREKADDRNLLRVLLGMAEFWLASLDVYKELKNIAGRLHIWEEARPAFLKLATYNARAIAEVFLFEHEWPNALALAKEKDASEDVVLLVAEGVTTPLPQESIRLYLALMQKYIGGRERWSYQVAATFAQKIKSIYTDVLGDPTAWEQFIGDVRMRHKHFRALLDEFRGV